MRLFDAAVALIMLCMHKHLCSSPSLYHDVNSRLKRECLRHQDGVRQEREKLAYTMSLEQQNMHLQQENLDLREVWFLTQITSSGIDLPACCHVGTGRSVESAWNIVMNGCARAACRSWRFCRSG